MYVKLVECDGKNIIYLHDIYKDINICKLAMKNKGNLDDIPDHIKTKEFCEWLVKTDIYRIKIIPDHLKTIDMCQDLVKTLIKICTAEMNIGSVNIESIHTNLRLLEYIPRECMSIEMCIQLREYQCILVNVEWSSWKQTNNGIYFFGECFPNNFRNNMISILNDYYKDYYKD